MKIKDTLIVLFIVGAMSLVANAIGTKYTIVEAIPGLLFLIFLAIAGVILAKYLPGRIPAVAYIVTLGCILTYPTMPGSDVINEAVKKVGFLQLCTPILAYAGIAIGKDLDAFAKSGWRFVVVACVVFTPLRSHEFHLSAAPSIQKFTIRHKETHPIRPIGQAL